MLKNSTCRGLQSPIKLPAQQHGYPKTSFLRNFFDCSGISKMSRYHSNQKFLKKVEIWLKYGHLKMAIWVAKQSTFTVRPLQDQSRSKSKIAFRQPILYVFVHGRTKSDFWKLSLLSQQRLHRFTWQTNQTIGMTEKEDHAKHTSIPVPHNGGPPAITTINSTMTLAAVSIMSILPITPGFWLIWLWRFPISAHATDCLHPHGTTS